MVWLNLSERARYRKGERVFMFAGGSAHVRLK